MSGDISHEIAIRINEKLSSRKIAICIDEKLSRLPDTWKKGSIFRVHGKQRSDNKESYDPQVVSIGPYHRGKPELMKMEEYKLRCLQELLNRRPESSAEKFTTAMAEIQDQARNYYAEVIGLSTDDFVEMLCLDGCFVIGFLRKLRQPELEKENDPIFQMSWLLTATIYDLILFENQLPIFVLHQLFEMTKLPDEEKFIDLAATLSGLLPFAGPESRSIALGHAEDTHLLDLMHKNLSASLSLAQSIKFESPGKISQVIKPASELIQSGVNFNVADFKFESPRKIPQVIKPASELMQSGIKFKVAEYSLSSLHITFKNGVLEIPPLVEEDHTESIVRNLIAYEQHMSKPFKARRCITDYIIFMDLLIDSPSDVEKLRNSHIITCGMGNDEAVSTMFNKLANDVTIGTTFCYTKIFEEVSKYSSKRRNIWRAHLMRDYFNTPWSIISFLAAFVLILLTIVQTIFSILQCTLN